MQKKQKHLFPYKWKISETNFTKDKGKVFSCFSCGGGSSFGYKLAGFDVIGCNEIDPKMMDAYMANHNPQYPYLEPIQTFKLREDFPDELYNLDILDGSPPCSSFSMSGNREKDWGKEKVFREGQAEQVLDTLFFDFIDLAKKLQPKVVIAENVKGIILGEAKQYVREIYKQFDLAGYYLQHWLLDASVMGVPQRRERVFFIALRKDLAKPFLFQKDFFTEVPKINLDFNEPIIPFKKIRTKDFENPIPEGFMKYFNTQLPHETCMGETSERQGKREYFNQMYQFDNRPLYTMSAKIDCLVVKDEPRFLNTEERILGGTFPLDYIFGKSKPHYIIGMSVPPVMVAQIATRIHDQWLSKL